MERLVVWHRWCPPPESSPEAVAQAALWRIGARERFVRDGAEVIAELGGTAVFALDPTETPRAVEICLALIDEVASDGPEAGGISCALAISELERAAQGAYVGDALDRAQALANRSRVGEIVLDEAAQNAAATTFLFSRTINAGPHIQGEVIDRTHPRRRECRAAVANLSPPHLPGSAQTQLAALRHVAQAGGRHRVTLVGPYGAGTASWIRHLAAELGPPAWLDVRALASAIAPLSALSYALRRLPAGEAPEALLDPSDEHDRVALAALADIRRGSAVSRKDAALSLRHLLARCRERHGRRAWISVTPMPLVDPASIAVIAEAVRDGGPECLLLLRLPPDARAPEVFARGGTLAEVRVPTLSQQEARALAQSMLGKHTDQDIARRAAAMGGSAPLGVAEAVRVLIATGDVVFEGDHFQWRRGPAGRPSTLTVEALLEARIDDIGLDARRLLEALATVPDPDDRGLVAAVADADGLSRDAHESALEELVSQALIEQTPRGLSLSRAVRHVVEQAMPPARLAELSRFVADVLERYVPNEQAFSRAGLAYYVARGGRPREAADMLLEVAVTAGQLGFIRAGVRLAAAAVECDPSEDVRARAAEIAEQLNAERARAKQAGRTLRDTIPDAATGQEPEPLPVPDAPRPLAAQAMSQAIDAILARDFEAVERALELVVAAGRDGPSVDRLRAIAQLVHGDRTSAQQLIDRAKKRENDLGKDSPRTPLAISLVLLETGQPGAAVRQALHALACARNLQDAQGEQAALRTLAMCYRRLDRTADATELEEAGAPRLPAAPLSGSSGE